eukprot:1602441-Rhodomonas_salina.4
MMLSASAMCGTDAACGATRAWYNSWLRVAILSYRYRPARYAMPGTELAYGAVAADDCAMRGARLGQPFLTAVRTNIEAVRAAAQYGNGRGLNWGVAVLPSPKLLLPYALPMRCPGLTCRYARSGLRAHYAMSGTDIAYGATGGYC